MAERRSQPLCAVIFTAIPIEYKAVLAHLKNVQEEIHEQGTIYSRGTFSSGAQSWDVVLVEIGVGNTAAALEGERAVIRFQPDVILFVGVAGGLKDVQVGDVVAATKVYGYESGRVEQGAFQARPEIARSTYRLEQRARAEARRTDWLQQIIGVPAVRSPTIYVGSIASGEKVLASTHSALWAFLKAHYNDALAVDMEGHGFLSVAHANSGLEALVVRGISDLIDDKTRTEEEEHSQELAARHASAFAFEILAKLGEDEPFREHHIDKPGTLLCTYDIHAHWIGSLTWSPDSKYIASGGGDGTVRVWDASTGKNLLTYRGHARWFSEVWIVAWSPQGNSIASGGRGRSPAIHVWDSTTGQRVASYDGHSHILPVVTNLTWSPDGKYLASTCVNLGLDQAVHIWDARSGRNILKIDLHSGLSDSAGGVAWSPDGEYIACGKKREVQIHSTTTGKCKLIYDKHTDSHRSSGDILPQTDWVANVAWSPDGTRIASVGWKTIHVWDATTGATLIPYIDHTNSVRDISWSPNSQYIASASNDKTVHIWNARTGSRLFIYDQHKDEVASVAWSPDGTRIASACKDGKVHVWQAL